MSDAFNFNIDVSQDDARKHAFHRAAKQQLRCLARELGMEPKDYDLRADWVCATPSGEIMLQADGFYVCVRQLERLGGVMLRASTGRSDHADDRHQRNYLPLCLLHEPAVLAVCVRAILPGDRS